MKYLFTAQFNDGSEYKQSVEDTSLTSEGKSAFFDIVDRSDIKTFRLEGAGQTWLVDLADGHFEHNGVPFGVNEPILTAEPLRLIYFRRNIIDSVGTTITNHDVSFYIGWQTNDETGKNHKQLIQII